MQVGVGRSAYASGAFVGILEFAWWICLRGKKSSGKFDFRVTGEPSANLIAPNRRLRDLVEKYSRLRRRVCVVCVPGETMADRSVDRGTATGRKRPGESRGKDSGRAAKGNGVRERRSAVGSYGTRVGGEGRAGWAIRVRDVRPHNITSLACPS